MPLPTLILLPEALSICRLTPGSSLPEPPENGFWSLTQTADELSLVCPTKDVPGVSQRREDGWRALRVAGTLDFSLIGILAPILRSLAEAEISVFTLSTYDTDYLLLKDTVLEKAVRTLIASGYPVES